MMAGIAALTLMVGVLLALSVALGTRHRAEQAADLAALAGATAVQRGGDGCAEARRVAAANAGVLTGCRVVDDGDVLVSVERAVPSVLARWLPGRSQAQARARAGPVTAAGSR